MIFFAGPGQDCNGNHGSPLILLNEAKGERKQYCNPSSKKAIIFGFNDKNESESLKENIQRYLSCCHKSECQKSECLFKLEENVFVRDLDFKDCFSSEILKQKLACEDFGKFVLLDQFGFSQVDETVFKELARSPSTDFIFFIASSFIARFKDHPYTKKYIDTSKIDFDNAKPVDKHGLIADYFAQLIGNEQEFYLHHFTIRKGANYYGLIFGTGHTYGMEKFLKVCWAHDELAGESNDNKYGDYQKGTLFYDPENSNKIELVKRELRAKILSGDISDNISGLKFALKRRCLPKLFVHMAKELERQNLIKRVGKVNDQATKIHSVPRYQIVLA